MKSKKDWAVAVALGVAGALTLSGCVGDIQPTGDTSGTGEPATTLTISRFAGPWADALTEVVKGFTEETGIQVRVDAIDYAQLQQKQTLNMGEKTGEYDVVYVPENWYSQYIAAGYLEALDDNLSDPAITGQYVPTAMDILKGADGLVYGLPDSVQTDLMCYNTDAFAEAGLEIPATWDEMLPVAKHFKDAGTGIAMPARQGTAAADVLITLAQGNGGSVLKPDGSLNLTSPEVVEAATFNQELVKYSVDGSTSWHFDESVKALQFGEAPLGVCLSGLASALEDAAQSKVVGKLAYRPMPYKKAVGGYLLTWNYSVAADSKHKAEAVKLVEWLSGQAAQRAMLEAYPGPVSLRNDLFEDASLGEKYPWIPAIKETLSNSTPPPLSTGSAKFMDAVGAAMNGVFVNGTDPKTALAEAEKQLEGDF
ncbi:MAG: sugar ABC transporter substrate-binding protein [Propionibacteriaceae bacterium]|jgi:ABC-type glycerol-3-phosphate transport system substrate-binding protein|nr:sugar ABC transporter substrate-binding protein [Propionibacteriaceae bacterium]